MKSLSRCLDLFPPFLNPVRQLYHAVAKKDDHHPTAHVEKGSSNALMHVFVLIVTKGVKISKGYEYC